MNRITAIAIYMTLAATPAISAQAQPASAAGAQPFQTQRAAQPAIRCTQGDSGTRALQPCRVRPAVEATHLSHDVSHPEFECMLSGVCGVVDRSRVNG